MFGNKMMKKRDIFVRSVVAVTMLFLLTLWLKELTQRRARRAADDFMGHMLTRIGFDHDTFIPVFWHDHRGTRQWPGWFVSYSTHFAIGEPVSIYVDVFGRLTTANSDCFGELIEMPEDQRCKRQAEMIRKDIEFWEKADREREKRKAEQSVPPNPRSPSAQGSGGR